MFFFTPKSAGWAIFICGLVLLGMVIFGAVTNGLPTPEAKSAMLKLVGISFGFCAVGGAMVYLFGRRK